MARQIVPKSDTPGQCRKRRRVHWFLSNVNVIIAESMRCRAGVHGAAYLATASHIRQIAALSRRSLTAGLSGPGRQASDRQSSKLLGIVTKRLKQRLYTPARRDIAKACQPASPCVPPPTPWHQQTSLAFEYIATEPRSYMLIKYRISAKYLDQMQRLFIGPTVHGLLVAASGNRLIGTVEALLSRVIFPA